MNANKTLLGPMLTASAVVRADPPGLKLATQPTPPAAQPTTIGQLADMARQKRIADETKPGAPAAPSVPAGMRIVPPTAIHDNAKAVGGASKRPEKPVKPTPPPEIVPGLLAIAKAPNGMRYVELADTSGPNRYLTGQVTPSGWSVDMIGAQYVRLTKQAVDKKPARQLTLSISSQ